MSIFANTPFKLPNQSCLQQKFELFIIFFGRGGGIIFVEKLTTLQGGGVKRTSNIKLYGVYVSSISATNNPMESLANSYVEMMALSFFKKSLYDSSVMNLVTIAKVIIRTQSFLMSRGSKIEIINTLLTQQYVNAVTV